MKIELLKQSLAKSKDNLDLIFVLDEQLDHDFIKDIETLKSLNYKGKEEEVLFLPEKNRLYIGAKSNCHDSLRTAGATAARKIRNYNYQSISLSIYDQNNDYIYSKAIVEGLLLGKYTFNKYKSDDKAFSVKTLYITEDNYYKDFSFDANKLQVSLQASSYVCEAVNLTRDIVNTPPSELYPETFANKATEVMTGKNSQYLKIEIKDQSFLEQEQMNAMLAVCKGSVHEPKLIHMSYKPIDAKKKIVFVGKGVTFDSGGLSLKPANAMETMKADKSGACTVLGIMSALADIGPPFEIHGIIGAVENMPDGKSYKPDDILISRNKKSIEVKNTDAEGRLVLADCLDYACDLKPDYIIDLATLTGACVVGLGDYSIGVMGNNVDLKSSIIASGKKAGEFAVDLPFNKHLRKLIKSQIADVSNTGSSRMGGAITAGLFLENFVADEYKDKWVHLDIAGPAFVQEVWGCNPYGASGAGVRMLLQWLNDLKSS